MSNQIFIAPQAFWVIEVHILTIIQTSETQIISLAPVSLGLQLWLYSMSTQCRIILSLIPPMHARHQESLASTKTDNESKNEVQSGAGSAHGQLFASVGQVKNTPVAVRMIKKGSIVLTKELNKTLIQVRAFVALNIGTGISERYILILFQCIEQLKDLTTTNIYLNQFIAACVTPPNICTMWTYCSKGSLQVRVTWMLWASASLLKSSLFWIAGCSLWWQYSFGWPFQLIHHCWHLEGEKQITWDMHLRPKRILPQIWNKYTPMRHYV